MSNYGASVGPKPRVTLLAALPAIGHAFGPADAVGTAVRKHLDPNVSAVYENVLQSRVFPEGLETDLECRHRDLSVRCVSFGAQANPAPAPSSAMSPAGYSLAPLSSKRLRFADRFISWARSEFESTGKYTKPELLVRPHRGHPDPPPLAPVRLQNRRERCCFILALTYRWRKTTQPDTRILRNRSEVTPTYSFFVHLGPALMCVAHVAYERDGSFSTSRLDDTHVVVRTTARSRAQSQRVS
jgi:hypothetical protein